MNRLFISLGTIACLGFVTDTAIAANGSIAGSMARDFWLAAKRNEAQNKPALTACAGPQANDNVACKPERKGKQRPV